MSRVTEELLPISAPSRRFKDGNFRAKIAEFLSVGPYLNGEHTLGFETEFASYLGTTSCVGVSSGTSALELALMILDLQPGDSILTPANAGGYSSIAALRNQLTCDYYDVSEHGLPTSELLDSAKKSSSRVAIITHLYGQAANMREILSWANSNQILIIEDCAQAAGAEIEGQKVGTFGLLSTFSFYPTKNLGTVGDAGAICTNDSVLADRLIQARQYGWSERYFSSSKGSNLRMDEIHAFVLRDELKSLDDYNLKRRKIWRTYSDIFNNYELGNVLIGVGDSSNVAHLGVIKTKERKQIRSFLLSLKISSDIHYPYPDYRQPNFQTKQNFLLANTEQLCRTVLTVPLFESMSNSEIERVSEALKMICERRYL